MDNLSTKSDHFQAIIFDLDGTLLDTLADIAESVNRTLAEYHFPLHALDAYCFFIGNGWKMLVTRALPEAHRSEQLIAECVVTMEFHGASEDLARIVHAHPTLSEAVHEAALHVDRRAIHRGN